MLLPYQNSIHDTDGVKFGYAKQTLAVIYELRGYNYELESVQWGQHFPVYFRNHREFLLDNRRHDIIDCSTYDRDPMGNDNSVQIS